MGELSKLEELVTILIIQEDAKTVYSLLQTEKDFVFFMGVIPYYALFIQSLQEYMGTNFSKEFMKDDFKKIRNHIKIYAEKFKKISNRLESVDNEQNEYFKNKLRFNFLKTRNSNFNLGSYWIDNGVIIGNTQRLADFLSLENLSDPKEKDKIYQLGCKIGSFVAAINEFFSNSEEYLVINRPEKFVKINYYYDINTNRKNKLFLPNKPKELNILFLHLLCDMNFVKYILRPLLRDGNTWMFRVEYVVTYYTFRALDCFKNYCESNNIKYVETEDLIDIREEGSKIFKKELRNCMMHYNLKGEGIITFENIYKPFYGIIENCFHDVSYNEYLVLLHDLSDKIISYLEKQFDFSNVKLKKF